MVVEGQVEILGEGGEGHERVGRRQQRVGDLGIGARVCVCGADAADVQGGTVVLADPEGPSLIGLEPVLYNSQSPQSSAMVARSQPVWFSLELFISAVHLAQDQICANY